METEQISLEIIMQAFGPKQPDPTAIVIPFQTISTQISKGWARRIYLDYIIILE